MRKMCTHIHRKKACIHLWIGFIPNFMEANETLWLYLSKVYKNKKVGRVLNKIHIESRELWPNKKISKLPVIVIYLATFRLLLFNYKIWGKLNKQWCHCREWHDFCLSSLTLIMYFLNLIKSNITVTNVIN